MATVSASATVCALAILSAGVTPREDEGTPRRLFRSWISFSYDVRLEKAPDCVPAYWTHSVNRELHNRPPGTSPPTDILLSMSGGFAFPRGADARLVEVYAYDKPDVRVHKLDIRDLDPKVFVKRALRGDKEPKADNATESDMIHLQVAASRVKKKQKKVETPAPEDSPKQAPQDTPTERIGSHPVTDVLVQKVKFTFHWRSESQGRLLFVFKVGEKLHLVEGVLQVNITLSDGFIIRTAAPNPRVQTDAASRTDGRDDGE